MDLQDALLLVAFFIFVILFLVSKANQQPDDIEATCNEIVDSDKTPVLQEEPLALSDWMDVSLPCPPNSVLQESMDPFYLPIAPWADISLVHQTPTRKSLECMTPPPRAMAAATPSAVQTPAPASPQRRAPPSPGPVRPTPRRLPSPARSIQIVQTKPFSASPSEQAGGTGLGAKQALSQRKLVRRAPLEAAAFTPRGPTRAPNVMSGGASALPSSPVSGNFLSPSRPGASSPGCTKSTRRPPRSPVAPVKAAPSSPTVLRSQRQAQQQPQQQQRAPFKVGPLPLPPPPTRTPPLRRTARAEDPTQLKTPTQVNGKKAAHSTEQEVVAGGEAPALRYVERHGRQERAQVHRYGKEHKEPKKTLTSPSARVVNMFVERNSCDVGSVGRQLDFSTPRATESAAPFAGGNKSELSSKAPAGRVTPALRSPTSVLLRAAEFEVMCRSRGGGGNGGAGEATGGSLGPATPPQPAGRVLSRTSPTVSPYSSAFSASSFVLSDESHGLRMSSSSIILSDSSSSHEGDSIGNRHDIGGSEFVRLGNGGLKSAGGDCSGYNGSGVRSAGGEGSSGTGGAPLIRTSTRLFSSMGGSEGARGRAGQSSGAVAAGATFLAFARATQLDAAAASPPLSPGSGPGLVLPKAASPPLGKRLGKPNMPRITGL